ncbi:TetR/AcrR family transcriptional regulator [Laceyella putida]|uniref:TetR/AcrR family transcriptional regulator n=1 Tax=Laceyella putida TaxID=110101 RepID=A0ABW2RKL0_9BACL
MDTEQKILCEAAGLFLKSGYAAVSISMITDAVGITKPTLYHYFPDKETLFAAVMCKKLEFAGMHIQRGIAEGGTVRRRLTCLAKGFFHYASMSMQPLMRDVDEQLRPELVERVYQTMHRAIVKPLQKLLQEGMEQGELVPQADQIPILVDLWLGMLDTLAKHCRKGVTEEEIGQLAEMVVAVFMDGIAKGKR